jgi:hypothetical protein
MINGQNGPIEQPRKLVVDPKRGPTVTRSWICLTEDQAEQVVTQNAFQGATITKEERGATILVTIDYGSDPDEAETAQDEFTLDTNTVQKDLLDSDIELVSSLNETNRDEFRQFIQDPSLWVQQGNFTEFEGDTDSLDAAAELWTMWQAGVRHIEIDQPVFRLSRFASRSYNIPFSYANVNKLLSTDAMKADSLAPNDFLVPIDSIVDEFGAAPRRADGLAVEYAWKKKNPRLNGSGWNKRRVDQEYVYGLWVLKLYGGSVIT